MAASATKDYFGGRMDEVHVPPCYNRECSGTLLTLVDKFREAGLTCQHKYRLYGLYTKCFQEFIERCCFTIVHVCPYLWKKMSKTQEMSDFHHSPLADKIMCIKFGNVNYTNCQWNDEDLKYKAEGETFFEQFTQKDISSEADINEFVNDVKRSLNTTLDNYVYTTKEANEPTINEVKAEPLLAQSADDYKRTEDLYDAEYSMYINLKNNEEHDQTMVIFPDMFGQTTGQDVHVRTEHVQVDHGMLISPSSLEKAQYIRSILDNLNNKPLKIVTATQLVILKKVIPLFYSNKDMFTMAHVALCNQSVLQDEAFVMLELLVLEGQVKSDNLRKTELLLSKSLEDMRSALSKPNMMSLSIQRLSNLLLMIRCDLTLNCPMYAGDQQRASKRFRLPTKTTKSEYMNNIEALQRKTPKQLMKIVNKFSDSINEGNQIASAKELIKKDKPTQMTIIYECLKKIFSTMSVNELVFLKEYVSTNKCHPECLTMITHALTVFLCRGLRTSHHRDIQAVCTSVMDVLYAVKKKDFSNETERMLSSLIFDKTPAVRKGMFHFCIESSKYFSQIDQHLLTEITRLLCPLLTPNTKRRIENTTTWLSALGTFDHKPVVILFHKPQEKNHCIKNEARFINFSDTMHISQANKLLTLHHENIITLFAYQISRIPQFYVLDDYLTDNLQIALKNKNDNHSFYDQPTLMKILSAALAALDHCHSRGIVHRNLTAESLFFVRDCQVKLGGFNLAIDLEGQEEVTFMNGSSQIPTRWSAQESLCKMKYSKATDISMFGHTMYEVLTHGALPYSHVILSEHNFVKLVTTKQIQLYPEVCIKTEANDVIHRCVAFNPNDRPDTETLKEVMSKLASGITAAFKPKYPSLTETPTGNMRQPSTCFGKGTPEYDALPSKHIYVESIYIGSSDGLKQYKMGEGYLFSETVTRKMSQQLQDQLSSATSGIIPPCMTMIEISEDRHIFEYYISTLSVLNILDFIWDRLQNDDIFGCMNILVKIAEMLDRLHTSSFVLGDISMSSVFLECEDTQKINIVSWAYFNCIQTFSNETGLDLPQKVSALNRTAPEVQQSGLYSPASDVYCFGHLLKDFSDVLRRHLTEDSTIYTCICSEEESSNSKHLALLHCLANLSGIADQCTAYDKSQRLTLASVIQKINNLQEQAELEFETQKGRKYSETMAKILLDSSSDSQSQVIPKTLFQKRTSVDSAIQSMQSNNESETMLKTVVKTDCIYEELDHYQIYNEATSSPGNINYKNLPVPKAAARIDLEPAYSKPSEFPKGYRHIHKREYENDDYCSLNETISMRPYEIPKDCSICNDKRKHNEPSAGLIIEQCENPCPHSLNSVRSIPNIDVTRTSNWLDSIAQHSAPTTEVVQQLRAFPELPDTPHCRPFLLVRRSGSDDGNHGDDLISSDDEIYV